ncbi:MAG: hypothetical protein KatS3mg102_1118 [Planctomycetota bacterium]|nr:MAG: hypothetical protein KatS3mg102_1118 [Planctomycetota bacterium]
MLYAACKFVHLLAFAAYTAAVLAGQVLVRSGRREQSGPAPSEAAARLAAALAARLALPALVLSLMSGLLLLHLVPGYLRAGWLHAKLACVLALLVLAHLAMLNARALARAQAAGDAQALAARGRRHTSYGAAELGLVAAVAALATLRPF